jgi:hypothetical protein
MNAGEVVRGHTRCRAHIPAASKYLGDTSSSSDCSRRIAAPPTAAALAGLLSITTKLR